MYYQNPRNYRNPRNRNCRQQRDCNESPCVVKDEMRHLWERQVSQTRAVIVSITERLADEAEVTEHAARGAEEISEVFGRFYPSEVAAEISVLLTEHRRLETEIIIARRDGNSEDAYELNKKWYINADGTAKILSQISPYYNYNDLREMFNARLELTLGAVNARLAGRYNEEADIYKKLEKRALLTADYLVTGLT